MTIFFIVIKIAVDIDIFLFYVINIVKKMYPTCNDIIEDEDYYCMMEFELYI